MFLISLEVKTILGLVFTTIKAQKSIDTENLMPLTSFKPGVVFFLTIKVLRNIKEIGTMFLISLEVKTILVLVFTTIKAQKSIDTENLMPLTS